MFVWILNTSVSRSTKAVMIFISQLFEVVSKKVFSCCMVIINTRLTTRHYLITQLLGGREIVYITAEELKVEVAAEKAKNQEKTKEK